MSKHFNCDKPEERAQGLREAAKAVRQGGLVVLPTDTVYGIGADAFTPDAVAALLKAKGRGREMPVPVLIGSSDALHSLVMPSGTASWQLTDAFWPGPLTLVAVQQPSLEWDLGETRGTVAVRMPLHPVAIDLLNDTGPVAVSSANRSGQPPATTAGEAVVQLGNAVSVYLDSGPTGEPVPSSIVDITTETPRLLREGAISLAELLDVVPNLEVDT